MVTYAIRSKSRRRLPLGRRDFEALNTMHRLEIISKLKEIAAWKNMFNMIVPISALRKASILLFALIITKYIEILKIILVEVPETPRFK